MKVNLDPGFRKGSVAVGMIARGSSGDARCLRQNEVETKSALEVELSGVYLAVMVAKLDSCGGRQQASYGKFKIEARMSRLELIGRILNVVISYEFCVINWVPRGVYSAAHFICKSVAGTRLRRFCSLGSVPSVVFENISCEAE